MHDKHQHITVEELLLDEAFIEWVRMGKPINHPWHLRLEQIPALFPVSREAETILLSLSQRDNQSSPDPNQVQNLWDRIDKSTSQVNTNPQKAKVRKIHIRKSWIAAASVLLLVIASLFIFQNRPERIYAGVGENIEHTLPDESVVSLNAGSEISYDKGKFNDQRNVQLKGEAFFEVTKAIPFLVNTPLGKVEVLGTSFNVYAREGEFRVECKSGKVRVTALITGNEMILDQGMSVRLSDDGQLTDDSKLQLDRAEWKAGIFKFDNHPLKLVFEELENQFNIQIDATEVIEQKTYTGSFENKNLDTAMYHVTWPMNLKINEISKEKYQIVD